VRISRTTLFDKRFTEQLWLLHFSEKHRITKSFPVFLCYLFQFRCHNR
jgi:hypothetical protein